MDYPSNSMASKQGQTNEPEKLDKVVSGAVTVKKENRLKKDATDILTNWSKEVLIPSALKLFEDILIKGVKMAFHQDPNSGSSNVVSGIAPSYRGYWSEANNSMPATIQSARAYSYDSPVFKEYADAMKVLENMNAILAQRGSVSVGQMYDLSSLTPEWTMHKYGFSDLRSARVEPTSDGRWFIRLPKAIALN